MSQFLSSTSTIESNESELQKIHKRIYEEEEAEQKEEETRQKNQQKTQKAREALKKKERKRKSKRTPKKSGQGLRRKKGGIAFPRLSENRPKVINELIQKYGNFIYYRNTSR